MVLEQGSRRVVGVSMLGVNAGEVIHEAAMGLRFGATADDFIDCAITTDGDDHVDMLLYGFKSQPLGITRCLSQL